MTDHDNSCHLEHEHHSETTPKDDYRPLVVVVLIALAMAAIELRPMNAFTGYFFVLLSMFKFFDLKGFADGFQMYDIVAKRFRAYAYAYPFIELALGLGFLSGVWPLLTNVVTVIVMAVSAIGVIQNVLSGSKIKCVCLGTALNVPLSTVSVVENGGMGIMAAINIFLLLGQ
jgi:uncharacterized membrane protein YphA (DoxX/SURF4 family)